MQRNIGKEFSDLRERMEFLDANCDKIEEKGYMKPFTSEQMQDYKEGLADVSIQIEEIEQEKKASASYFNEQLKPLVEERKEMVSNIKAKAKYVKEKCFKFVDREKKMTGYYNSEGELIESRPATASELNPTMFSVIRNTGTED